MASVTVIPTYNKQQSTDSGWDNPFRPGGDLSREADEIVNMIRGGKPITPSEANYLRNEPQRLENNCTSVVATDVNHINISPHHLAKNGINPSCLEEGMITKIAGSAENNGKSSQVSKKVVPGPASASHIVIDDKKSSKKGCCSVQ